MHGAKLHIFHERGVMTLEVDILFLPCRCGLQIWFAISGRHLNLRAIWNCRRDVEGGSLDRAKNGIGWIDALALRADLIRSLSVFRLNQQGTVKPTKTSIVRNSSSARRASFSRLRSGHHVLNEVWAEAKTERIQISIQSSLAHDNEL